MRGQGNGQVGQRSPVPPHNLEAEASLLGAMLLRADAIVAAIEVGLSADDFYAPSHGQVYDAITSLHRRGDPADPLTVADELGRAGVLEDVGGGAALLSMQAGTPAIGSARRYARIVAEHSRSRSLLDAAGALRDAVLDGAEPEPMLARIAELAAPHEAADGLRARLLTVEQLRELPPPGWLVDGVLAANTLAVLYGRPGAAKTFLALDWALSVASGAWWSGREVLGGDVLYLAAEGVSGLGRRVAAWQQARNVVEVPGIQWLGAAVNLLDEAQTQALVRLVDDTQPVLVVIDTLARSMVGGDENSARDVGLAIEAADRIRQAARTAVLLVHHSGKDGLSPRGSSALEGAADTIVEARADGDRVTLRCVKAKDAEPFDDIALHRVAVADSVVLSVPRGRGTDRGDGPLRAGPPRGPVGLVWDYRSEPGRVAGSEWAAQDDVLPGQKRPGQHGRGGQ